MEKATFAAGCFWGIETAYRRLEGVLGVAVGYEGGSTNTPSYQDVCTGQTGHAEVVEVDYYPEKISYDELLEVFWNIHDPTTLNRQGPDIGTQYRSAIFFHSEDQKKKAELSKSSKQGTGTYPDGIVTEITPHQTFHRAEEYHQRYFEKMGRH